MRESIKNITNSTRKGAKSGLTSVFILVAAQPINCIYGSERECKDGIILFPFFCAAALIIGAGLGATLGLVTEFKNNYFKLEQAHHDKEVERRRINRDINRKAFEIV